MKSIKLIKNSKKGAIPVLLVILLIVAGSFTIGATIGAVNSFRSPTEAVKSSTGKLINAEGFTPMQEELIAKGGNLITQLNLLEKQKKLSPNQLKLLTEERRKLQPSLNSLIKMSPSERSLALAEFSQIQNSIDVYSSILNEVNNAPKNNVVSSSPSPIPPSNSAPDGYNPLYFSGKRADGKDFEAVAGWKIKVVTAEGTGEEEVAGPAQGKGSTEEPTIVQKAIEGAKNLFKKITSPFSSGGSSGGTGGTPSGTTGTGTAPSPTPEAKPSTTLAQKAGAAVKEATDAVRNAFKPSTPVTTGRVAPLTTSTPGTSVATDPSTGISTVKTDVGPSPTTGIGPAYGAPDSPPTASGGTGSSSGGGGSGGFSATPTVSDVVECPAGATICAVSPPEGSTVPKNFSVKLLITTRTPMSCRYSQTGPNFDFNGASPQVERFLEDVTAQPVNNHTDFLYGFNEGSYTFYHQCKNSSGAISSLTHNFKVGSQDLNVAVTCTNLKGDELEVCLNATAAEGAEAGKKSIDLAINKDGKTVKIVRLGTEITPEVAAPQQTGKAVVWIIIMMVLLSGILGFLFWRYKHLKNIEEESALKQDTTEIPQTQSAIAYMFGI